ncbi:MAG: 4-(cytidine 5'-diphospho)-2-C-methyl-D-erythritol kinase [Bacteroidales bacterium]|nr:4-(cytidine 5'-diphospho)-2-C-methyl-D-erythritol kinase [Bacteroidales bacterium]
MITHPNVKINLGLNVLRRREDGFHDLETLFVPYFGISDTLEIIAGDDYSRTSAALFGRYAPEMIAQEISEDGRLMITIARAEGVDWDPLKDLTAKAYMILSEDYTLPPVKIFLEKTSPVGAGLGGGSSDAAFALVMLNEMFSLGISEDGLAAYAARLGSDCAFFVYNRPMVGEGRGEILTEHPLSGIDYGQEGGAGCAYELQVLAPEGIAVSTKDAYGGIRPGLPEVPLRNVLARPVEEWDGLLINDFEETVFAKYPELAAIKRSLYDSGAAYASMSGSGSALFALYRR